MPKLWRETIEAHRRDVRGAILDTTAALVAEHGLASVTMSQIAEQTGIGRATLYKYFPDVEAILVAWHDGHVAGHLDRLAAVRDRAVDAGTRLGAVLEAYARIAHERSREHHSTDLAALVHRGGHLAGAQRQLRDFVRDVLVESAQAGVIRDDVAADELASYCLHALNAASTMPSEAAVRRLVAVTLAGLRPPRADSRGQPSAARSRPPTTLASPSPRSTAGPAYAATPAHETDYHRQAESDTRGGRG